MKKLPVVYPPLTCYPGPAQLLSILFCHREEAMPWFASNYIQIRAITDRQKMDEGLNMLDFFGDQSMRSIMKFYTMPRNIVDIKWKSFTEFLRSCIDVDLYVNLRINMYHFPCSPAYHKENFMHYPLIYGYDESTQEFMVSDFYQNSVYSFE